MTPRVDIYEDEAGAWRWRLRAGNGEIVATGESHTTERDARRAFADMINALAELGPVRATASGFEQA